MFQTGKKGGKERIVKGSKAWIEAKRERATKQGRYGNYRFIGDMIVSESEIYVSLVSKKQDEDSDSDETSLP